MELTLFCPWGLTPTHTTVYVVFNEILAGCYYSYADAEEVAWASDEPVQMYKSKGRARSALTKYQKKTSR